MQLNTGIKFCLEKHVYAVIEPVLCVHVYVAFGGDWAEAYGRDGSKYVAREISYAHTYRKIFLIFSCLYSAVHNKTTSVWVGGRGRIVLKQIDGLEYAGYIVIRLASIMLLAL